MAETYHAEKERKMDIASSQAQKLIGDARGAFASFAAQHSGLFDLADEGKIKAAYQLAEKEGIFEKAKDAREQFFGKDVTIYGVDYISDKCISGCKYCSGASCHKFERRSLSLQEFEKDVGYVIMDGHKHICLLAGDHPEWGAETIAAYVSLLARMGVKEIILNIAPQTVTGFRILRDAAPDTSMQFRVFQETYNRATYEEMHPWGPKKDFDFRFFSQARALEAGFDNVGLGFLTGLQQYPIGELEAIAAHADLIHAQFGRWPARVALPAANQYGDDKLEIPYLMPRWNDSEERSKGVYGAYAMATNLLYALARLALPHISIVASERDPPELLKDLFRFATNCTMNVQAGVGKNTDAKEGKVNCCPHFEQATTFPQEPEEMKKLVETAGYNLVG